MRNKPAAVLCLVFSGTGRRLGELFPGKVPYRPKVVVGGVAHCSSTLPACVDTACMDVTSRDPVTDAAMLGTVGTALEHISVPGSQTGWSSDGNSLLEIGVNNADILLWKCNSAVINLW